MNQQVENRLNKRSIKPTAMRILVLQYLLKQNKAVALKNIEDEFEFADKSTLFRTLRTFENNKLVHTIDDGTKKLKYALCMENCECDTQDLHYHFHCVECQNTYCLTNQTIPQIALPKNFTMAQANMVIKGACGTCNN